MTTTPRSPRIAIAHDYITQRGGAERVVLALSRLYPEAPIHTTLYDPDGTFPEFREREIITSPLNRVGVLRRHHRLALPFLAGASNHMHIDADVVIASSSGWAHGFPTSGRMLVYCHSPARWLYLSENYLGGDPRRSPVGLALEAMAPALRRWDRRAAARADRYVANANVIKARIKDVYGFDVDVVPPPFGVSETGDRAPIAEVADWESEGFALVVSRLLPYKNVDKVIEAFRHRSDKLLVIGAGPMADELRASATENVRVVSGVSDDELRWAYASCRLLVAPSYEDFGLTPLEVGAFGHPVAAFRSGGYLDTVVDGLNGTFFDEPTPQLIAEAVDATLASTWDPEAIRAHAETFGEGAFGQRIQAIVDDLMG